MVYPNFSIEYPNFIPRTVVFDWMPTWQRTWMLHGQISNFCTTLVFNHSNKELFVRNSESILWDQVRFHLFFISFTLVSDWLTVWVLFSVVIRMNFVNDQIHQRRTKFVPYTFYGTNLLDLDSPHWGKTLNPSCFVHLSTFLLLALLLLWYDDCVQMFTFATFWDLIIFGLNVSLPTGYQHLHQERD